MSKKRLFAVLVLLVLISSVFSIAAEDTAEDIYEEDYEEDYGAAEQECSFWCKVGRVLFGNRALVGEAADDKEAEARKLFGEGIKLYNEGKYKKAISKFQQAKNLKAGSGPNIYLARSYERIGDKEKALEAYKSTKEYLTSTEKAVVKTDEENKRLAEANLHISRLEVEPVIPQPVIRQGNKMYTYEGKTESGYPVYQGLDGKLYVGTYDGTQVYETPLKKGDIKIIVSEAAPTSTQPSPTAPAAPTAAEPITPLSGSATPGILIEGTLGIYYVKDRVIVNADGTPVTTKEILYEMYFGRFKDAFDEAKKKEAEGKEAAAETEETEEKAAGGEAEEKVEEKPAEAKKGEVSFKKKYDTMDAYASQMEAIAKNSEEKAKVAAEERLSNLNTAKNKLEEAKNELEKAKKSKDEKIGAFEEKVKTASDKVKELSKASQAETDAKKAKAEAEKARKDAESIKYQWSFTDSMNQWRKENVYMQWVTTGFRGLQNFLGRTSQYQGLSNLLMPEETQKWIEKSNTEFLNIWADLPSYAASHWNLPVPGNPSESCDVDDAQRSKTPGQSTAFVRTQSGTYQFVGSIQAEKSATKSKMLCERNPDEEAEEEFICSSGLLCKEDQFCYENEDAEEPAEGYFYKITWGVTAPQDEKFTPYIDENGKAVRFNLALYASDGSEKWIFKRAGGYGANVIALANGARDGGIIVKYLKKDYTRVCIKFDPPNSVIDYFGDEVNEICTDFTPGSKGIVEYSASAGAPIISSTSEQVTMDI
ncbi:MAG: hypothetical protein AB1668_01165 [Nanoarchaeota archaeon]